MNKKLLMLVLSLALTGVSSNAFASRDWEYWQQESIIVPLTKKISYNVLPEYRFKNGMHDDYMFKLETGPTLKLNNYFDTSFYYTYQEKKLSTGWDRSDIIYLDVAGKITLEKLFNIKVQDRLRYQLDFDKDKTTIRNSLKLSRDFKVKKITVTPYLSEEPFYDAKFDRISEHRTASGVMFGLTKNISVGLGYMLDSKWGKPKWTYSNVLVSNVNIKF